MYDVQLLKDYLPVGIFLAISLVLGLMFFVAPLILAARPKDSEKTRAYECGFDAFGNTRMRFNVRYYVIAILYVIFDLEIIFLFPWVVVLRELDPAGFWAMMTFLLLLVIGFVYEWGKGALEWQ
jgi:NADH-quinone oxidoreductase subunit A